MKLNRQGYSRTVLILNNYVIKFPTLSSHRAFLLGCLNNWSERNLYRPENKYGIDLKPLLCPSYFCSWFGLFQIQKKVKILQRDLTSKEIEMFKGITDDIKSENFGILNNKLVCIDYP